MALASTCSARPSKRSCTDSDRLAPAQAAAAAPAPDSTLAMPGKAERTWHAVSEGGGGGQGRARCRPAHASIPKGKPAAAATAPKHGGMAMLPSPAPSKGTRTRLWGAGVEGVAQPLALRPQHSDHCWLRPLTGACAAPACSAAACSRSSRRRLAAADSQHELTAQRGAAGPGRVRAAHPLWPARAGGIVSTVADRAGGRPSCHLARPHAPAGRPTAAAMRRCQPHTPGATDTPQAGRRRLAAVRRLGWQTLRSRRERQQHPRRRRCCRRCRCRPERTSSASS